MARHVYWKGSKEMHLQWISEVPWACSTTYILNTKGCHHPHDVRNLESCHGAPVLASAQGSLVNVLFPKHLNGPLV